MFIYKFEDGIFYSELLFDDGVNQVRLDSRTSDAIAIALRVKCGIYTTPEIVQECGVVLEEVSSQRKEEEDDDEALLNLEPEDIKDEVRARIFKNMLLNLE